LGRGCGKGGEGLRVVVAEHPLAGRNRREAGRQANLLDARRGEPGPRGDLGKREPWSKAELQVGRQRRGQPLALRAHHLLDRQAAPDQPLKECQPHASVPRSRVVETGGFELPGTAGGARSRNRPRSA
jgi:hypothetical protein